MKHVNTSLVDALKRMFCASSVVKLPLQGYRMGDISAIIEVVKRERGVRLVMDKEPPFIVVRQHTTHPASAHISALQTMYKTLIAVGMTEEEIITSMKGGSIQGKATGDIESDLRVYQHDGFMDIKYKLKS